MVAAEIIPADLALNYCRIRPLVGAVPEGEKAVLVSSAGTGLGKFGRIKQI